MNKKENILKDNTKDIDKLVDTEKKEELKEELKTDYPHINLSDVLNIQEKINNLPEEPIKIEKEEKKENDVKTRKARSKKVEEPEHKPFDTTLFIKLIFNLMKKWKGEHWVILDEELEIYAKHTNEVFNEYLYNVKYIPLYLWSFETLLLISFRIQTDVEISKAKKLNKLK